MQEDAIIYEDVKNVKPFFYGIINVNYAIIDSSYYVRISVDLENL